MVIIVISNNNGNSNSNSDSNSNSNDNNSSGRVSIIAFGKATPLFSTTASPPGVTLLPTVLGWHYLFHTASFVLRIAYGVKDRCNLLHSSPRFEENIC